MSLALIGRIHRRSKYLKQLSDQVICEQILPFWVDLDL